MTAAHTLAEFAANLKYEDIPPEVLIALLGIKEVQDAYDA